MLFSNSRECWQKKSSTYISEFVVIDTCGNLSVASSNLISYAAQYDLIPKPKSNKNKTAKDQNDDDEEHCNVLPETTGGKNSGFLHWKDKS